ncbi:MAG: cyclodeaminase/cyclohydrolase family protein [Bacillota bacterium]
MKFKEFVLEDFVEKLASKSPTPGGGSIAALNGVLSASLSSMVMSLTKDGSLDKFEERLEKLKSQGLDLIDLDSESFDKVMAAFKLSKNSDEEVIERKNAIQEALKEASMVPLETMKLGLELMEIASEVLESGNKNAVSDAGVAALSAMTAIKGGSYNVLINAKSLSDKNVSSELIEEVENIVNKAESLHLEIEKSLNKKLQ